MSSYKEDDAMEITSSLKDADVVDSGVNYFTTHPSHQVFPPSNIDSYTNFTVSS